MPELLRVVIPRESAALEGHRMPLLRVFRVVMEVLAEGVAVVGAQSVQLLQELVVMVGRAFAL